MRIRLYGKPPGDISPGGFGVRGRNNGKKVTVKAGSAKNNGKKLTVKRPLISF